MPVSAANGASCEVPDVIRGLYNDDVDIERLEIQLHLLSDFVKQSDRSKASNKNLQSVLQSFKRQSSGRALLNQVEIILRIFLTVPITTASAERSFSATRRLKTYLRSTMSQCRFNNLLLLHVHKDRAPTLDLRSIANQFICNERRQSFFSKLDTH